MAFLNEIGLERLWTQIITRLNGLVPITRTINNKALDSDIALTAEDIGAATNIALSDHINDISKHIPLTEIEVLIHESIYGLIDGNIENIINNKATYIRDYLFYQHQNLITADFSVATSIGNYAFYKCPELTSVDVPLTTNIGNFAFKGCSSLTAANYSLVTTLGQGAFDECTVLSSVNLPLASAINPLTFRKCEALTTIDLPVTTSIGTQAFYDSGVTSLTLRSNTLVTLENEDAFYFTPIEDGIGYIYVPSNLVDSYKAADGWSTYANQIQAIV